MDAVIIPFKDDGLDALIQKLQKLGSLVGSMSGNSIAAGATRAATGITRMGQAANGAIGPLGRLLNAQARLQQAYATGNNSYIWDAQYNFNRASAAYGKASNPKPAQSPFMKALMSSRVGYDGSIMPLVGNLIGAIGAEASVALGAVTLLASGLARLAETVRGVASVVTYSNASMGQYSRLAGLAGGLGVGAGDLVGRVGGAIGSTQYKGYLNGIGVNPYRSPLGGDLNDVAATQTVLRRFLNSSPQEAARMTRMLPGAGLEEFGWARYADKAHKERLLNNTGVSLSPNEMRNAANAMIDFNLAVTKLQTTLTRIGVTILPLVNRYLENFTNVLKGVQLIANGQKVGGWNQVPGFHGNEAIEAQKANTQAQQANTAAVNNLSTAIGAGKYGGGARAQGALPGGWGAGMYNSINTAWDLGAFTL